ncbi:hypothetical protein ABT160_43590 [Streptomyces sp. NPDC001941]|uniref:hypothetical protein n=1 Tax=Streptomyces sp. NPDC001941 TaxID=3154659 RepID=UPI003321D7CB
MSDRTEAERAFALARNENESAAAAAREAAARLEETRQRAAEVASALAARTTGGVR